MHGLGLCEGALATPIYFHRLECAVRSARRGDLFLGIVNTFDTSPQSV